MNTTPKTDLISNDDNNKNNDASQEIKDLFMKKNMGQNIFLEKMINSISNKVTNANLSEVNNMHTIFNVAQGIANEIREDLENNSENLESEINTTAEVFREVIDDTSKNSDIPFNFKNIFNQILTLSQYETTEDSHQPLNNNQIDNNQTDNNQINNNQMDNIPPKLNNMFNQILTLSSETEKKINDDQVNDNNQINDDQINIDNQVNNDNQTNNDNQNNTYHEINNAKCCICFENIIEKYALIPCGHVTTCKTCIPQLKNGCPVCRKIIFSYIQIFE
jgi:hypothetical protein